jgi:hypothetical protein
VITFEEAGRRYSELRGRRATGQLSEQEFHAALAQLRVQDARGVWWTLDPGGNWLWWNGSAWAVTQQAGGAPPAAAAARAPVRAPAKRGGRPWQTLSVLGGLVAAAGYYYYSSLRSEQEGGVDWQSAALIALVPILLSILRKPVDQLLQPFQAIRSKVPPLVLVGAGLIAPYVAAYYLYDQNVPGIGRLIQYEYMRVTLVVGTLLSYVILRTPVKR